jgi:glycosyltransferase involved in cell wall biosynthesis
MTDRPMRILVYCGGSYVSGAEIIELSVMKGLQRRGHEVLCITNAWNDGDFHGRLQEADIAYQVIPLGAFSKSLQPRYLWWTFNALLHLPKAYITFWATLRQYEPDVLLFAGSRSLSTLLPLVNLQKTVLHVHEVPGRSVHAKRVREANAEGGCAAYIAVSEFIGCCLENVAIPQNRIHVVQNGVEDTDVSPNDSKESTSDAVSVGIVGQVASWKGYADLLKALPLLLQKNLDFHLHIFGTGEASYTNDLKARLGVGDLSSRVTWHGFVKDISKIYSLIDICVVPSRSSDPFPTTALEAGASGLPVIATKRGGLPEIIEDGHTGFLVDAEAPEQIAECLHKLICSPDLRQGMGAAARERVHAQFSRTQMIDGVERVLQSVVRCN